MWGFDDGVAKKVDTVDEKLGEAVVDKFVSGITLIPIFGLSIPE